MLKKFGLVFASLGIMLSVGFLGAADVYATIAQDCSTNGGTWTSSSGSESTGTCKYSNVDQSWCQNRGGQFNGTGYSGGVKGTCTFTNGAGQTTSGGSNGGTPGTSGLGSGSDCVETSIIGSGGQYCDDNGSGVFRILNIVVNVLTMGVGVLGTLGIIIAGIQYLTASGNEAQMAKAKQRIIEVVIGLVVFGVMWAVLQFIIPGGVFG